MIGRIMAPERCPCPKPQDLEYATLHGNRDFTDMIKFKHFETGRLSWIIGLGPV